jgi:hypothetical protein
MSTTTILAIAIPLLVLAAGMLLFATARRRDTDTPQHALVVLDTFMLLLHWLGVCRIVREHGRMGEVVLAPVVARNTAVAAAARRPAASLVVGDQMGAQWRAGGVSALPASRADVLRRLGWLDQVAKPYRRVSELGTADTSVATWRDAQANRPAGRDRRALRVAQASVWLLSPQISPQGCPSGPRPIVVMLSAPSADQGKGQ